MVSLTVPACLLVLITIYYGVDAGILEYTRGKSGGSKQQPKTKIPRPSEIEDQQAVLEERAAVLAREIAAMCNEYFQRDEEAHSPSRRSAEPVNEENTQQEQAIQRICMEILQRETGVYWRMP